MTLDFLLSIILHLFERKSQSNVAFAGLRKTKILNESICNISIWLLYLIRKFRNRALNNRINRIHKLALRLVYQNKNLSISELLELDNAVNIHQRNLQVLVTEICKVKNSLSPEIVKQVFDFQDPYYNLRSETSQFRRENIKTTH